MRPLERLVRIVNFIFHSNYFTNHRHYFLEITDRSDYVVLVTLLLVILINPSSDVRKGDRYP